MPIIAASLAAVLLHGPETSAYDCVPPNGLATLELVSITEDGAPVEVDSARDGTRLQLLSSHGTTVLLQIHGAPDRTYWTATFKPVPSRVP